MTELHRALARNMKTRRGILKLSQMELAERAELSSGYIGELEIGRKYPAPEVLERLALALETRPYRLVMTERDQLEAAQTAGQEAFYAAADEFRSRVARDLEEMLPPRQGSNGE